MDEDLQPNQVHAAMRRLEKLSDKYEFRDKGFDGKVLYRSESEEM